MKPDCYVGVDAGTTYTKAVVLRADGAMGEVLRIATPTARRHGATFFDLAALEEGVRRLLEAVRSQHRVLGVAFTSVGESVVPVRDGRALADALVWHDPATEALERRHRAAIEVDLPQRRRGCASNPTFSIYKILWMREVLGVADAEWWLPLSSFLAYRFTRQPRWDYSQASRTLLLDVSAGEWSGRLLERFELGATLPPLAPMGTALGSDDRGTVYSLGGHDHITGLYCVHALMGRRPFLFDSIGSSESVVALTTSRELFSSAGGLCVGAAFGRDLFYALKGVRVSGTLLEWLARLRGCPDVEACYQAANEALLRDRDRLGSAFPILAGGDPVAGDRPRGLSLLNVPLDATPSSVTHSAYAYLATVARMLVEEVGAHLDPGAILVTSGAAAANPLYMSYRATIVGRPLHVLTTHELGGLGAALCAARGRGDEATVEAFAARQRLTLVEPDEALIPDLRGQSDALLELYRGLPGRSLLESLA